MSHHDHTVDCSCQHCRGTGTLPESEAFLGDLWDTVTGGVASVIDRVRIEDRTHLTSKSKRKGKPRSLDSVYALVLHQMAFRRKSRKYDKVTAHFAILEDGTIQQLHPVSAYLYASDGFNRGSVAVEFAGNFPDTKGKCWSPKTHGCHALTQAQIDAGRYLIRHLIRTIGLTHVLAHRQSNGGKTNDPGPDIWYHVGQWAVDNLGLKDGGPGFAIPNKRINKKTGKKVPDGKPIPSEWRTWGRLSVVPELEYELIDGMIDEMEVDLFFGDFWDWITGALSSDIAYDTVPGQDYGPKFSTRPGGLPANARKTSARGAALPHVERLAREQGLGDTFIKAVVQMAKSESGGMFARPANTFDARPPSERPAGKGLITAWGVFQFNRDAWTHLIKRAERSSRASWTPQGTRGCSIKGGCVFPWDATAHEEIDLPIKRYAELYREVCSAGGSHTDAARALRLWHISPTAYKNWLKRAQSDGFQSSWKNLSASHQRRTVHFIKEAGIV